MPESLGVKVVAGLDCLSAGLAGRNKEAEAVFPEQLDDQHTVHVLQHRFVVVHLRERRLRVFLSSARRLDASDARLPTMKALLKPGWPTSWPIAAAKMPNTSCGRKTCRARREPGPSDSESTSVARFHGAEFGVKARMYEYGGARPTLMRKEYVAWRTSMACT